MKKQVENILFSNDLGYSSIKGSINGTQVNVPSAIALETADNIYEPKTFMSKGSARQYMTHFINHMNVSIKSPSVSINKRMLVGNSAVDSGLNLDKFDVYDGTGKSQTSLSIILTLSTIAATAVKDYYTNHLAAPTHALNTNVMMTTALPIDEGDVGDTRQKYEARFMANNGNHTVTFHNFAKPITVHVHFKQVVIGLEGETAVLAIRDANPNSGLVQSIRHEFYMKYPDMAKKYAPTGSDIAQAQSVLGIDIGEGTTDFSVIYVDENKQIHADAEASNSIMDGYGKVLTRAYQYLNKQNFDFHNRNQFARLLNAPDTMDTHVRKQKAIEAVDQQAPRLARAICDGVSQTVDSSSHKPVRVFIYGGGSIPMKPFLFKPLNEKLKTFNSGLPTPCIFVDPRYARFLNERGLKMVLSFIAQH